MLNNLIEELKVLAENILKEDQANDLALRLSQSRELYEKLLVLRHELTQEEQSKVLAKEEHVKAELQDISEIIPSTHNDSSEPEIVTTTVVIEEEPPLSLNDLFVPTFDGIKEDMSQKAEFKDTISLDETENLFQVKKEEPRQLSLNDKLVGSSIQVGLNDRIAFVNKLFSFSQSDFNKVLSRLNECNTKEEALNYFQYQVKPNYNWKGKEDLEERFKSLIERKFL
jgi:hypothetical protein